jgi:Ni,Fe-hydrogenase I large subunit
MLDGAGVRNTVIMIHSPSATPDASVQSHTVTQTAVLVESRDHTGKIVQHVFDPYMASESSGGRFVNPASSEYNGQPFDKWQEWNRNSRDQRTQLYNASLQDNPQIAGKYNQARQELGKDFLSNREFYQWQLENDIKAAQQRFPDPNRFRQAVDTWVKLNKQERNLSDQDIQEVLAKLGLSKPSL